MRASPIPPDAATTGDFGPIFWEHRGDPVAAIQRLIKEQTGEVPNALYHPQIGFIDLVWGKYDPTTKKGYGLSKIIGKHPEIDPEKLQDFINSLTLQRISNRQAVLTGNNNNHIATVRLDWNHKQKRWLMTAFKKGEEGGVGLAGVNPVKSPTDGPGEPSSALNTNNPKTKSVNELFDEGDDLPPELLNEMANDFNSSPTNTLADQEAHLQQSRQQTNNFRAQKLKELFQSFAQPRTQTTSAPHAATPDTRQKIADLQNLIAQKQEAISRAEHPMQNVALSARNRLITCSTPLAIPWPCFFWGQCFFGISP